MAQKETIEIWPHTRFLASIADGRPIERAEADVIAGVLERLKEQGTVGDYLEDVGTDPLRIRNLRYGAAERFLLGLLERDAAGGVIEALGPAEGRTLTMVCEVVPIRLSRTIERMATFTRDLGHPSTFAEVEIEVEPSEEETITVSFEERGGFAQEFRRGIIEGIRYAAARGKVPGRPLRPAMVRVIGGRDHPVSSSISAFRAASAMALFGCLDLLRDPGL